MRSEFLMPSRSVQYEARAQLRRAGFNALCLDLPARPMLIVEHHDTDLARVRELLGGLGSTGDIPAPRDGSTAHTYEGTTSLPSDWRRR